MNKNIQKLIQLQFNSVNIRLWDLFILLKHPFLPNQKINMRLLNLPLVPNLFGKLNN